VLRCGYKFFERSGRNEALHKKWEGEIFLCGPLRISAISA